MEVMWEMDPQKYLGEGERYYENWPFQSYMVAGWQKLTDSNHVFQTNCTGPDHSSHWLIVELIMVDPNHPSHVFFCLFLKMDMDW